MQKARRSPRMWLFGMKDPISCLTHLLGAILSIIAFYFLISWSYRDLWKFPWFMIYGLSLVAMYSASTLYHALPLPRARSRFMQRIDHASIFLLIAGSYAPVCMIPLYESWGIHLMLIIGSIAIYGITHNLRIGRLPRKFLAPLFAIMGCTILLQISALFEKLPLGGFVLFTGGGALYLIGALVFALKRPNPLPGIFGFHEVFHVLVLFASFLHFLLMTQYLLPFQS